MSEKPTIDELRAEWDKAVLEISAARSWQSAAAMRDTAYGKAKRLIASLEAHAAAQQQRIDELEKALEGVDQTVKAAFEYGEQAGQMHLTATMLLDYDQRTLNEIAGYCAEALRGKGVE